MSMAQTISSLVLSLRKKVNIKVRQPLRKILVPVQNDRMKQQVELISELIKNEVNIKEIEYLAADNSFIKKKINPDATQSGRQLRRRPRRAAGDGSGEQVQHRDGDGDRGDPIARFVDQVHHLAQVERGPRQRDQPDRQQESPPTTEVARGRGAQRESGQDSKQDQRCRFEIDTDTRSSGSAAGLVASSSVAPSPRLASLLRVAGRGGFSADGRLGMLVGSRAFGAHAHREQQRRRGEQACEHEPWRDSEAHAPHAAPSRRLEVKSQTHRLTSSRLEDAQ